MNWVVSSWTKIAKGVFDTTLLNILSAWAERPRGCLLRILRWMFSWWRYSTSLVYCFLLGSSKEWLGCAWFGKLRLIATWARGVLTGISHLVDISLSSWEAIAFSLMRFLVLAHIIVDVIVMGGTGFNEIAWGVSVNFVIFISTSTPGWNLSTSSSSLFSLHRVC